MSERDYRILVTGSRRWTNYATIYEALNYHYLLARINGAETVTLVHGDCPTGADCMADRVWRNQDLPVERHPADWQRYREKAGPIRNQEMVDAGADICLAFWHPTSRGTVDCMTRAEKAGIEIKLYEESSE